MAKAPNAKPRCALAPASRSDRVLRSHAAAKSKVIKHRPKPRRRADPWAPKTKPKRIAKPRAPPPTHFTCRICIEEQPVSEFIKWVPQSRARRLAPTQWQVPVDCIMHLGRNPRRTSIDPVCKACIGNHLSARLDQVGARLIGFGCLEPGCSAHWMWDLIVRNLPEGAPLEKYNLEMLEVWKQDAVPKPFTCLSPTCDAIGLPDTTAPGYPQVSCNTCAFRSCAECGIPWHKEVTCAEIASRNIEKEMSDADKQILRDMQKKDGKRCPNCLLVIEKDGGCDSMFCPGCHKYFNWSTAASAVPGAKKADPIVSSDPYMHHYGPVVCEMDAIQNGIVPPATPSSLVRW